MFCASFRLLLSGNPVTCPRACPCPVFLSFYLPLSPSTLLKFTEKTGTGTHAGTFKGTIYTGLPDSSELSLELHPLIFLSALVNCAAETCPGIKIISSGFVLVVTLLLAIKSTGVNIISKSLAS
jgi:hypothetical protein